MTKGVLVNAHQYAKLSPDLTSHFWLLCNLRLAKTFLRASWSPRCMHKMLCMHMHHSWGVGQMQVSMPDLLSAAVPCLRRLPGPCTSIGLQSNCHTNA